MPTPAHRTPLSAQTAEYRPRKPQDTLLHRLVREHLATFVAYTEATYAAPLPRYVKDAFERYLLRGRVSTHRTARVASALERVARHHVGILGVDGHRE